MRQRTYSIEWDKEAAKQFKKITDQALKDRILDVVEHTLAVDPHVGKPLTLAFKGVRSYRMGRLRILYKAYPDRLVIVILRIEHRRDVYRHPLN